jgi:signal transduction histidine kinase
MAVVPPDSRRSGRWSATALLLVVALLIGSVAIPARFTSRILGLLRQSRDAIEPARRVESQLELDLDLEATAVQEYELTGDRLALDQRRSAQMDADRDVAELEHLASGIDNGAVARVLAVRTQLAIWRARNQPLFDPHLSRAELTSLLRAQQRSRDSTFSSVTVLESYLAREAGDGAERIARFEEESLTSNATLVLLALAAMFAVAALVQRERRLSAMLTRRMENEAALRGAAEAFAGVFANDDLTQDVARSALSVLRARAAFVEVLDDAAPEPQVVIAATAGVGAPPVGSRAARAGSLTQAALEAGEPRLIRQLATVNDSGSAQDNSLADCALIVVPVVTATGAIGALVASSGRGEMFTGDDLTTARTFGHLVSLAYEKIRLLNEARDRRRELERVMSSRSRLMRGFSHDIKNPLGAADGYADMLATGVYGPLSPEQRDSVERLRGSIKSALDLITDLHEFARAETGNISLCIEPVVLRDVIRASCDEFRGVAAQRGLALSLELSSDNLIVDADALRVRQIMSNLLSNAIKYTARGSVVLRLRRVDDGTGTWAAVDVQDTGEGIAPDQLSLLFEEFIRLTPSKESGAGLGLAISQRLADMLGGRITVRSELGRGSCFTLWLRISNIVNDSVPAQREQPAADIVVPARDATHS